MTLPPAVPVLDLASFAARTGLESHPNTDTDSTSGWSIWAGFCDVVTPGHESEFDANAVVVYAQPPDGAPTPDAVLYSLTYNTLDGFDTIQAGGDLTSSDPDVTMGGQLFLDPYGNYFNMHQYGSIFRGLTHRNYYDTVARGLADPPGGREARSAAGSLALGTYVPLPPEADYSYLWAAGSYFRLAAVVLVGSDRPTTYPNFAGFERVAGTTFSVGSVDFPLAMQAGAHRSDFSF